MPVDTHAGSRGVNLTGVLNRRVARTVPSFWFIHSQSTSVSFRQTCCFRPTDVHVNVECISRKSCARIVSSFRPLPPRSRVHVTQLAENLPHAPAHGRTIKLVGATSRRCFNCERNTTGLSLKNTNTHARTLTFTRSLALSFHTHTLSPANCSDILQTLRIAHLRCFMDHPTQTDNQHGRVGRERSDGSAASAAREVSNPRGGERGAKWPDAEHRGTAAISRHGGGSRATKGGTGGQSAGPMVRTGRSAGGGTTTGGEGEDSRGSSDAAAMAQSCLRTLPWPRSPTLCALLPPCSPARLLSRLPPTSGPCGGSAHCASAVGAQVRAHLPLFSSLSGSPFGLRTPCCSCHALPFACWESGVDSTKPERAMLPSRVWIWC